MNILLTLFTIHLVSTATFHTLSPNSVPLPLVINYDGLVVLEALTLDRIPSPSNTRTNGTLTFSTKIAVTAIGSLTYCNYKWCSLYSCPAGSIGFEQEVSYLPDRTYTVGVAVDMPEGCERTPQKLVAGKYRLSMFVYTTNTETAILSGASATFDVADSSQFP